MPNIYLTHPKHGAKVATNVDEARADMANGWKIFTPGVQARLQEAEQRMEAEKAAEPVVNALPSRRGRGRPRAEPQGD